MTYLQVGRIIESDLKKGEGTLRKVTEFLKDIQN